jgi:outer membrane protein assembly factor BamB
MLLIASAAGAEDRIELLDGARMRGKIVKEGDSSVTIRLRMGASYAQMEVDKERIWRIHDGSGARVINEKAAPKPKAPEPESRKPEPQDRSSTETGGSGNTQILPFGWRGDGSGFFPNCRPPTKFSTSGENLLWKVDMPGWTQSSPVIAGNDVFILSQPTWLYCIDKITGEVKWKKENNYDVVGEGGKSLPSSDFLRKTYGYTCPTPVTDGKWIYCSWGHGVVTCRSVEDGSLKWASRFEIEGKQRSGISQSPALCGNVLVTGGAKKHAFAGWDVETGRMLWHVSRHGGVRGKGSLQTLTIDGKPYCLASDGMILDPAGGSVVQRDMLGSGGRNYGPTPVVHDGMAYLHDLKKKHLLATPIDIKGGAEPTWRTEVGGMARSPLYYDGLVFVPTKRMRCLDAKTGKELWEQKVSGGWGSPAIAGGLLYLIGGGGGDVVIIKPGRRYQEVARFSHGFQNKGGADKHLGCSPVFEGSRLYYRDAVAIWCFGSR